MPKFSFFILLLLLSVDVIGQPVTGKPGTYSSKKWAISVSGGYSDMLNKVPFDLGHEFAQYMKRLKSGWHTGIDAGYFFTKHVGAGISYTAFFTRESQDSLTATNGIIHFTSDFSNIMYIQNLAPMLFGRLPLMKGKMLLIGGGGPAYLNYHNTYKSQLDSATLKGSSAGFLCKAGIEYSLSKNINLGINTSYTYAFLKKITRITVAGEEVLMLDKSDYLKNISRIDLGLNLRWMFN